MTQITNIQGAVGKAQKPPPPPSHPCLLVPLCADLRVDVVRGLADQVLVGSGYPTSLRAQSFKISIN